jgi:hypothetical protein
MSYARFSEGDIYIFRSWEELGVDVWICCGCCLTEIKEFTPGYKWYDDFKTYKIKEMVAHVESHIAAGHRVPQRCLERLKEED